MVETVSRDWK